MLWNRRRELLIVALMNTLYAFSYFQRIAVPGTIFNELQSELLLTSTAIAMFGSLYLYVYGGMQIFSGMLVDRFGPMRVILSGGVLLSLGSVFFPLSHTLSMLYFTRVLVGLGASLMFLSLIKEIDIRFSSKNFSVILSSTLFAGYVGGLLGTGPFEAAVGAFGWRTPLLGIGIVCSVFVALTAILMKNTYVEGPRQPAHSILPAIKRVILNRLSYPVVYTGVIIFANYFLMQAIIGKKFLQDCCGFTSGKAASYLFMMMLASIAMSVFSGIFTRLIGNLRKPILIASSIATIVAPVLAMLVLSRGQSWILPCYILFGVASGGNPMTTTLIKELNEPKFAASSVGLVNGAVYVSIAVFTTLTGRILDSFSSQAVKTATAIQYPTAAYKMIFIGLILLAVSALVSSLFIRETYGRNIWSKARKS